MDKEYETQVLDIDVDEISKKLRKLGAKETPEILQKRWVFDIECLGSKDPGLGEWIRLRQAGDKNTITYKKRRGSDIDSAIEMEIEVDNFDQAAKILSQLPCFPEKYYQENKRAKFELNDIEFTIDTWPMIPPYLEIEAKSKEKVHEGLKMLDLTGKDAGHIGGIAIYKKYGIDLHSYKELKFK